MINTFKNVQKIIQKKHNKYIPGTNIQIKSRDDVDVDSYEYILVLAWNFFESIVKNNKARFKKSKFIKLK